MSLDLDRWIYNPLMAGAVGAVVSLRWAPGENWLGRLFNVLCGTAITTFGSPAAWEYFRLTSNAQQTFTAFALGVLGMNLAATVVTWVANVKIGDLLAWRKG